MPGDFFSLRAELSQSDRGSTPGAAGRKDRTRGVIWSKVFGAFDSQEIRQPIARAVDAALDGADRAFADRGRLLIREARSTDQDERLTLVGGQLGERRLEFLELKMAALFGVRLQAFRIGAVCIFHFTPPFAVFRPEQVAKNCEEPGRHVGTRLK